MNFQDYNTYIMMMMTEFHDFALMLLIIIMLYIMYMIFWFFNNIYINKNILHNQFIEIVWTIIPVFILIFMALPSLKILYMIEETMNPNLSLKILGHQWYWSYEYCDFYNIDFDSFMILNDKMKMIRLLDVDNRLILPYNLNIRGMISSVDVIHSWALPVLGVKVDAVPGRINQCLFYLNRMGIYYGQCSEICGLNHSFMPIVLESVTMKNFLKWLKNF
uniref:Cytochrome c oxidase subunit 2 n=1 Tax=Psyttalia lounsburyi TaxID=405760 RepID=A0A8A4JEN6_9HYME|nr:cytochrome oxidase subunit 2 [Psyttalia lounsburyi]